MVNEFPTWKNEEGYVVLRGHEKEEPFFCLQKNVRNDSMPVLLIHMDTYEVFYWDMREQLFQKVTEEDGLYFDFFLSEDRDDLTAMIENYIKDKSMMGSHTHLTRARTPGLSRSPGQAALGGMTPKLSDTRSAGVSPAAMQLDRARSQRPDTRIVKGPIMRSQTAKMVKNTSSGAETPFINVTNPSGAPVVLDDQLP
eukprot:UN27813